jgi:hypothetical protein
MVTLVNRAKVSTATTGTGTITLGSAESGYQTFADAGVVDANVVRYVIEDGTNWEIGTGTYTATGTTLSRTVLESSNADVAINLSGSAVVFVGAAAEDLAPVLELYAENPSSPTAPSATGANAVAIGSGALATDVRAVALGLSRADGDDAFAAAIGTTNLTYGARATGAVAIGYQASATALQATAVGTNATATGSRSQAIGYNSDATNTNSNAFGNAAQATGVDATAIGRAYASGTDSFAAAIANNTATYGATGANSVAIGNLAKASGNQSTAIGDTAQATGLNSICIGDAVASGRGSIVIDGEGSGTHSGLRGVNIGYSSSGTADYSVVFGFSADDQGVKSRFAFSGSTFNNDGDSQQGMFPLRLATTDATPAALTTDDGAASTNNQIILPNNSAYAFHGTIVARQQASGGTACAAWKVEGLIRREGSAGTTVLVNSATTILDNTPAWGMVLSADTTNGGLKIEVTGAAATNIRWVSTINTSEVTY